MSLIHNNYDMGTVSRPLKRARSGMPGAVIAKRRQNSFDLRNTSQDNFMNPKSLKVHECSFIRWHVAGITSVAATPSGRYVAVARSNGSIELRDEKAMWATISVFYANEAHRDDNITGMAFSNCGRYLFTVHLLGVVVIFKVTSDGLTLHTSIRPGGGAIWDVAIDRSFEKDLARIAIASDDGCVRIITPDLSYGRNELPSDPSRYHIMATEKTAARVLSVCWSPAATGTESTCIVCGDAGGGVRWLSSESGSSFGRGIIPSVREGKAMVWTLQFANGGREVMCGDSRGLVTVWSSATKTMTAEKRIEGMRGALWASALVTEENGAEFVILGSAGGGIGGMKKEVKSEYWTPIRAVQLHTHDVRSLCCLSDGNVLSGSLDALMRTFRTSSLVSKKDINWIRPYNECVGQPAIQFSPNSGIITARIGRSIELWSVPRDSKQPLLLLRMNISSISSELLACAVSKDYRTIALSATDAFRLYEIWNGEDEVVKSLQFGKVIPKEVDKAAHSLILGCVDLCFGDKFLACLTRCRRRMVLLTGTSHYVATVDDFGTRGSFLCKISCAGNQIAVSDTRGNIYRCLIETDTTANNNPFRWSKTFSHETSTVHNITALSFSESGKRLAISTASRRVCVLHLESGSRKEFDLSSHCSSFVQSISFSKSEKSLLISGQNFCIICTHEASKRKKKKSSKRTPFQSIHVLPYKDSILGTSIIGPSRIAIVRRTWQQMLPSLPDAIPKKLYGT